ncbi:hypothetical protein [Marinicellulosiphila megalodicopiae]|uniref:hypothetical protein n=1 Tax=Marinicellulosiphila megalodicopiae TaxID=2724896 RepID=UPI003BB1A841
MVNAWMEIFYYVCLSWLSEANVGNSGDEQSSINSTNQSEDKDVKYNEGLSKQDEKNKDSQKNDSNNQESKEKAPATKTEEEKPKDEQEKKCETCGKAYNADCPGSNPDKALKSDLDGNSKTLEKKYYGQYSLFKCYGCKTKNSL